MDVAVTHAGAPGLTVWRNVQGRRFERVSLPMGNAIGGWGLTPIDFDNDGWIDLAVIVDTPHGTRLRVVRNCGTQGFKDVTKALGLADLDVSGAKSLIAADVDGDGAPDLIVARERRPQIGAMARRIELLDPAVASFQRHGLRLAGGPRIDRHAERQPDRGFRQWLRVGQ